MLKVWLKILSLRAPEMLVSLVTCVTLIQERAIVYTVIPVGFARREHLTETTDFTLSHCDFFFLFVLLVYV